MKAKDRGRHFLTILGIVICLSIMMVYNHISYYTSIMGKMQNMGMGIIDGTKEKVEKYLSKDIEVVQTTAFALEYMIENNVPIEEMEEYLVYESNRYIEEVDSNFTGIYGFVKGEYIDGSGWVPDADYIPQERDWYIAAQRAQGETVMISPYLDAKTNTMMMSIGKMFPDKESVIAIDITLNEIQYFVEDVAQSSSGVAFIVDKDGRVISHSDIQEIGKNYLEDAQMASVLDTVYLNEQSYFETQIEDKKYQICANRVMGDWYAVMVLDTDIFFKDVHVALMRNIPLYGIISL